MKQEHLFFASCALLGLAVLKFMLPGAGTETRESVGGALALEPETAAVFREIGKQLSLREQEAVPVSAAASVQRLILMPVPSPTPEPSPQPTPFPTPEPTEEPLPAAVTAFLESQAEFSDYTLPENVDYTYSELPFSYAVPVSGYNSSGFGYRMHPILNTVRFHYGTDFAAFSGERVTAFADGCVSFAGYDDSFGYHVRIDHGSGWETLYAHCSALYVSGGQQVTAGECIALVGETGLATGPHLHFELTHDGRYLNPEYYING